jgi:hypothetical protein
VDDVIVEPLEEGKGIRSVVTRGGSLVHVGRGVEDIAQGPREKKFSRVAA